MKKRTSFISIFLSCILIMSLSACSSKEDSTDNINEDNKYSWKNTMDIKKVSFDNSEDCQPYWNSRAGHQLAKSDMGYYCMYNMTNLKGIILGNFNPETGECVVLCDRAQCAHDNEKCPAFFNETEYLCKVWRYKEKLYVIKCDSEKNAVLVQLDLDGKNRKELFEIGKLIVEQQSPREMYNLTFCDADVYIYRSAGNCQFSTSKDMEINVRRRSLDGKKDEIIMKSSEDYCIFDSVKAYGGNIFFAYTHYITEDYSFETTVKGEGLFCYNPDTGELGKIIDKRIIDYSIDEKNKVIYYYVINEGLYKYEFDSGNDTLIYKAEEKSSMCQITYAGGKIYMDNGMWAFGNRANNRTWILDTDGKVLKELQGFGWIAYLGDEGCIFTEGEVATIVGENPYESSRLMYFSKSDMESDSTDWKKVKWN